MTSHGSLLSPIFLPILVPQWFTVVDSGADTFRLYDNPDTIWEIGLGMEGFNASQIIQGMQHVDDALVFSFIWCLLSVAPGSERPGIFDKIDLVIVGPEEPLVKGISDFLNKNGIKTFGPNKYVSKLEGSKSFMKLICKKYKIPTANFKICKNQWDVKKFLKNNNLPIVVKADGLAAGKGVTICNTKKKVTEVSD